MCCMSTDGRRDTNWKLHKSINFRRHRRRDALNKCLRVLERVKTPKPRRNPSNTTRSSTQYIGGSAKESQNKSWLQQSDLVRSTASSSRHPQNDHESTQNQTIQKTTAQRDRPIRHIHFQSLFCPQRWSKPSTSPPKTKGKP
jgi:hypothetical protein